jgi:hypothetical protein
VESDVQWGKTLARIAPDTQMHTAGTRVSGSLMSAASNQKEQRERKSGVFHEKSILTTQGGKCNADAGCRMKDEYGCGGLF